MKEQIIEVDKLHSNEKLSLNQLARSLLSCVTYKIIKIIVIKTQMIDFVLFSSDVISHKST